MREDVPPYEAARPIGWSPRNFCFDELDRYSACIPYGMADLELPVALWGKTIRIEGRVLSANLPYKSRWVTPACVHAFEKGWQRFFGAAEMGGVRERLGKWFGSWPNISTVPALEVSLDGATLFCHTPTKSDYVAEGTLPPRPDGRRSFRLSFRLRNVTTAEVFAGIAKWLLAAPMPLALWSRMRDWQFRSLQHRRLRLLTVLIDGELVLDFRERSASPGPLLRRMSRPGLNILGHFLSEHSIGEAARGSVRAVDAADIPACLVRLRIPLPIHRGNDSIKARLSETMTYPVSIYHVGVREVKEIEQCHGIGWMNGRYNIGFWAWEAREFPEEGVRLARAFNEIWSPSQFAAEAIQMSVSVPVLTMPHVIEFPMPSSENLRSKFRLPEKMFLFLFVFDLNSSTVRKNPDAVVEAYRRVVAKNPAAGLVLKTHNTVRNAADMERLHERIAGLPNVFLIDRLLPRQEVYELMNCCDAFVSLHRAEGFGLCVAEAMFLGKPVLSTDWSATAEYVTPHNGFPVRYKLVRLEQHSDDFIRGTEWAEPDVEHAAWCMEKLLADPRMCGSLGAQGARDMRERFSAAAVGHRYARRLESILFW